MVHLTAGIYGPPQVGKIAERLSPPAMGEGHGPPRPQDLLAHDSVKVASISDVAGRTSTYRSALRSLDDINGYLSDII